MTAATRGIEVIGVMDGYIGFVEGNYIDLNAEVVRSIETKGGTVPVNKNTENSADNVEKGIEDQIQKQKELRQNYLEALSGEQTTTSSSK